MGARRGVIGMEFVRDTKAWRRVVLDFERGARASRNGLVLAARATGRHLNRKVRQGLRTSAPGGRPLMRNTPATLRKKSGSRPLIDTGTLSRSIVTRVVRRAFFVDARVGPAKNKAHPGRRGFSGVPPRRRPRGEVAFRLASLGTTAAVQTGATRRRTVGRIAAFHEFGFRHVNAGRFLRRRFLLPVLLRERPFIVDLARKTLGDEIARNMIFFNRRALKTRRGIFRF